MGGYVELDLARIVVLFSNCIILLKYGNSILVHPLLVHLCFVKMLHNVKNLIKLPLIPVIDFVTLFNVLKYAVEQLRSGFCKSLTLR